MSEQSTRVAYITIEAVDLLRICFEELLAQPDYKSQLELILRGTLPRQVLENIEKSTVLLDPKGLSGRFTGQRRVYIDSWSELIVLGSLTRFFEAQKDAPHYMACIGIETAHKESKLREKFLSDGAIASREMDSRQMIQSCLAQNIKGGSAGKSLQQEVIIRLKEKLTNAPDEPGRILAVTIMSETEGVDSLDFSQIAQEIEEQRKNQTTYENIFCILPGFSTDSTPQVAVIPLWLWMPGSYRISTVVNVNMVKGSIIVGSTNDVEFSQTP
jgi:hypothetical protein